MTRVTLDAVWPLGSAALVAKKGPTLVVDALADDRALGPEREMSCAWRPATGMSESAMPAADMTVAAAGTSVTRVLNISSTSGANAPDSQSLSCVSPNVVMDAQRVQACSPATSAIAADTATTASTAAGGLPAAGAVREYPKTALVVKLQEVAPTASPIQQHSKTAQQTGRVAASDAANTGAAAASAAMGPLMDWKAAVSNASPSAADADEQVDKNLGKKNTMSSIWSADEGQSAAVGLSIQKETCQRQAGAQALSSQGIMNSVAQGDGHAGMQGPDARPSTSDGGCVLISEPQSCICSGTPASYHPVSCSAVPEAQRDIVRSLCG